VENENVRDHERNNGYYSKKLRAGKRRTYFFDVRATKGNDYYLTITESKKRPNGSGYDSHKVFLYKEDFKRFIEGLEETISHIKKELMPDFDFENFTRDTYFENNPREDRPMREDRPRNDYNRNNSSNPEERDPILREMNKPKESLSLEQIEANLGVQNNNTTDENVDTW
jgi:hypothetical protein